MPNDLLNEHDLKDIEQRLWTQKTDLNHAAFAEQFDTGDGVPPLGVIELLTSIAITASALANSLVNRYID